MTAERNADRRFLVTGAGSGIGQACALRFLAEGATVVGADISADGLADTVAKAGSDQFSTVVLDVGDEDSVMAGVGSAVTTLGGLDGLVNAAGILRAHHTRELQVAEWDLIMRVNLRGTFLMIRESLDALRAGTAPAVVNFSSTSAGFAHPYMAAYAASKGGIQSMTHALALEFAKDGIRFNCVQPGSISSGMTDGTGSARQSVGPGLPEDVDWSLFGRLTAALPLPGGAMFADPSAVAAVVTMLASPDAFFVTGTEVRVDGGTHM